MLRGNSRREVGQIKHKLANSALSAPDSCGRGISQLTCPIPLLIALNGSTSVRDVVVRAEYNPSWLSVVVQHMARKLVVVGAGPVGCLAAIALAKMGWSVEIYEARPGICLFQHGPPLFLIPRQICAYLLRGRPPSNDRLTSPYLLAE
jgi:NADPH-dependent 2,4-dienoyl-CoA reductase/sulfur reductase-like enzyme